MFADGAIFEIIMLICFGCSWPVTIFKTVKSKTVKGITPVFYYLVLIGYISGAIYKLFYHFNYVFFLYIINIITVSTQLGLYYYYYKKERIGANHA
ncbi:MAG: hypothetical protein UHW86_05090 [Spirochaetota bacterium]|nr:hypothetical protein [Spirochaetota bacterium]